jgi:hypothetical protein
MDADPAFPFWGKQVLRMIEERDPVDAMITLEAIAASIRQELDQREATR